MASQPAAPDSHSQNGQFKKLRTSDRRDIPTPLFVGLIALCAAPTLLNLVGIDFGITARPGAVGLERFPGAVVHALLEWSAFSAALFTFALALLHYKATGDSTIPIFGLALLFAGMMDSFHTLAALRLIGSVADPSRFIPFTWAISRLFNAAILLTGVALLLWGSKDLTSGWRQLGMFALGATIIAWGLIFLSATAANIPQTEFPDSFVKRPFDVPALVLFVVAIPLFRSFKSEHRNLFSHALVLSLIPNIVVQLHMTFFSSVLFDNSFNIAHFLKIFAYATPLIGLLLEYENVQTRLGTLARNLERNLLRREHTLNSFMDIGQALVMTVDLTGGIEKANEAFMKMFGLDQDGITGVNVIEKTVIEKDKMLIRNAITNVLIGEIQTNVECTMVDRSGAKRNLIWTAAPQMSAEGEITGALIVGTDITQQKETEANLRIIKQAVASSGSPIAIFDLEGIVTYVNDALVTFWGFESEADVVGTPYSRLSASDEATIAKVGEEIWQQGFWKGEARARLNSGDTAPVEINASIVRDESGKPTAMMAAFTDLTNREKARNYTELQLELAEGTRATLAELAASTAYRSGNVEDVSRKIAVAAAADLHVARVSVWFTSPEGDGIVLEDLFESGENRHSSGLVIKQSDNPDYFAALEAGSVIAADNAVTDPRTRGFRKDYLDPLGITSKLDASIIVDDNFTGVISMEHVGPTRSWSPGEIAFAKELGNFLSRALTNRARAESEAAANLAAEELRRLIEDANAPIFGTDTDGHINEWNGYIAELTGFPKAEVMGRSLTEDFISDDFREYVREVFDRALRGQGTDNYEVPLYTKRGNRLLLLLNATPRRDADDQIIGVLGIGQDITQRERHLADLEAERASLTQKVEDKTADLTRSNLELARAARAKDEFLASMSHELRTPLSGILAISESLREDVYGKLADQQRKALEIVDESGHHLLTLINDILDLAKVQSGSMELDIEPVETSMVGTAAVRFVRETAMRKNITVTFSCDSAVATVNADHRRLRQCLINLLSNAVKFTPEGGEVSLEVKANDKADKILFTVTDNGVGISAENLDAVFDPFVQLDARLAREHEGTGLGLALVREMVELHGGGISAASGGKGLGCVFTIWLPHTVQVTGGVSDLNFPYGHPLLVPTTGKAETALVVEDSDVAVTHLANFLGKANIDFAVASLDQSIPDQAFESAVDIIFLDIMLDDISGWTVLEELKQDERVRDIPVVVTTVLDEPKRAKALGASGFLQKPFNKFDFEAEISRLFAGPNTTVNDEDREEPDRRLILLADDNEISSRPIADFLRSKRFEVVIAKDGQAAVDLCRTEAPDAILMDVQMPIMDGIEATRTIRSTRAGEEIPIIMLTALAMPGDRERCLAAGATDYMTKPIGLKKLVGRLNTLLGITNQ